MSKDADKSGLSRLWSGGRERERAPQPDEKVLPMKAPAEVRQAALPAEHHDRAYAAFETREQAGRLHIMRGAGPSRFPGYHYLLDISFDHHLQSAFTLIYTFMIVEVTGRNLGPVVHAINFGNCERIREYHPRLYDPPAQGEPFIEKIHITAADESR
jgi:hypothetical protein